MAIEEIIKDTVRCTEAQHNSLVAGLLVSGAAYTEGNTYLVEAPDILTVENNTGARVIPTIKTGSKEEKVELGNKISVSNGSLVCTGTNGHYFSVSVDTTWTTAGSWTYWLLRGNGTIVTETLNTNNEDHFASFEYSDIVAYQVTSRTSPPYDASPSVLSCSGYLIDNVGDIRKADVYYDFYAPTTYTMRRLLTDVTAYLTLEKD